MSGATVKYSVRPNKAMERHLFLELLRRLNFSLPIDEYSYYGMGGYCFEDFKLIHLQFGISRMYSFEDDIAVVLRQEFNKPFQCIEIVPKDTGYFIDNAEEYLKGHSLIWLDYANSDTRMKQIDEFERLLPKLKTGDIIKITLNANPRTLFQESDYVPSDSGECEEKRINEKDLQCIRLKRYIEDMESDYCNYLIAPEDMSARKFPNVLLYALQIAAEKGLDGGKQKVIPLTSFVYNDGWHQMLTFTGIIQNKDNSETLGENCFVLLKGWYFLSREWNHYIPLRMPGFTIKEKLLIDSLLPLKDIESIVDALKNEHHLPFEKTDIEIYAKCYRQYPNFHQVFL